MIALINVSNSIDKSVISISEFSSKCVWVSPYSSVIYFGSDIAKNMIAIINGYSLIFVFASSIMLLAMSFVPAYFSDMFTIFDEIVATITEVMIIIIDKYSNVE